MKLFTGRTQAALAAILAAALTLGAAAAPAQAGSTDMTATDIIRSLAPIAPGAAPTAPTDAAATAKLRAQAKLVRRVTLPAMPWGQTAMAVELDLGHARDFDVFFAYDSATLDATAKAYLAHLGEALSSPDLQPFRFLLAGNTDAAGSSSYNRDLSLRRASAVRAYLVASYHIAPDRLLVAGFGSKYLRDAAHPLSGVNRRVEVALVLPQ